jgi:hypothetical protein
LAPGQFVTERFVYARRQQLYRNRARRPTCCFGDCYARFLRPARRDQQVHALFQYRNAVCGIGNGYRKQLEGLGLKIIGRKCVSQCQADRRLFRCDPMCRPSKDQRLVGHILLGQRRCNARIQRGKTSAGRKRMSWRGFGYRLGSADNRAHQCPREIAVALCEVISAGDHHVADMVSGLARQGAKTDLCLAQATGGKIQVDPLID